MTILDSFKIKGTMKWDKSDTWFGYKQGDVETLTISRLSIDKFPWLLEVGDVKRCYPELESIRRIWDFDKDTYVCNVCGREFEEEPYFEATYKFAKENLVKLSYCKECFKKLGIYH